MKKCTFCRIKKDFSEFHCKGNGNFMSRCKKCMININAIKYQIKKITESRIDEMRVEQWRQEAIKGCPGLLEKWYGK